MSEPLPSDTAQLLNSLPEPAFAVSLDKTILGMNAAAEALTGVTADAAQGRPCAEIVPCEVCGPHCPLNAAVEQGHAITSFNVDLEGARGHEPVSLHTAPIRTPSGAVVGVLECARPIGHLVGLFQAL